MNSIIVSLLLLSVAIFIMYIKDFFSILPIVTVMIMFAIDGCILYLLFKMNINKQDIAFGILISTILKVSLFTIKNIKHE